VIVTHLDLIDLRQKTHTLYVIGGTDSAPLEPLLCDETRAEGGFTHCERGHEAAPSVELFATGLAADVFPYATARQEKLESELASFGSDVVCLQELWGANRRQHVADLARDVYRYQVAFDNDMTTPFTDPNGLGGTPPTPRTEPYCAGDAELAAMNAVLDCLRDHCSTTGDESGLVPDSACALGKCGPEYKTAATFFDCGQCLAVILAGATIGGARATCSTELNPMVFGGASGALLLSKLPLDPVSEKDDFIAPSTFFRRDIVHALARTPTGPSFDVYCGYSPQVPTGAALYFGVYGEGANNADAWRNERKLYF